MRAISAIFITWDKSPGGAVIPKNHSTTGGIIYVLRSKSDLPVVAQNRDLLLKFGLTGGSVKKRAANAKLGPTFLMADVEIVTTYELYNINRVTLENLPHRIFEGARLDIETKDRFGHPSRLRNGFGSRCAP
jgi:hypothetical protein